MKSGEESPDQIGLLLLRSASDYFVRLLARNARLETSFQNFMDAAAPPENMQGLLFAADRFKTVLTNPKLPSHWNSLEPFRGWVDLFSVILNNVNEITHCYGKASAFGFRAKPKVRSIIYPQMDLYPYFAMACRVHADPSQDLHYAGLQLQCFYAHWRKVDLFRRDHPDREGRLRELPSRVMPDRDIKLGQSACRAIGELQVRELSHILTAMRPLDHPDEFFETLQEHPSGIKARELYADLRCYCKPEYDPRCGGSGGERSRKGEPYLFLVDYLGRSYGLTLSEGGGTDGAEDDGSHEIFVRPRVIGFQGTELTKREIIQLGLDPLELACGADFVSGVERGQDRHQARESAHAAARSFEIDRRLFPWNSQAVRLFEFQKDIRPVLETVRQDESSSVDNSLAAAVIAVLVETGRTMDDLLGLRVENQLSSRFAYRPPRENERCGTWRWDALSPRYEAELGGEDHQVVKRHELQVERAEFLTYPASEIVTDLIARWMKHNLIDKHRRLFPFRKSGIWQRVLSLFKKNKVADYDRFKPARLRNLIWTVLHEMTGGELASSCLVLGLAQPMAQVELFYALLHEQEAALLFENAKQALWVNLPGVGAAKYKPESDPPTGRFTGCRAFPQILKVKDIIGQFRRASLQLFDMDPSTFDVANEDHRRLFNNGVMYGVWHQAFSFGTRAITDAYQPLETLSDSGVGLLDDKGFADGYRTRIVAADVHLRMHMRSLEQKLATFSDRIPGEKPGQVWLLDEHGIPAAIRPATIQNFLDDEFPFPVNVPRKIMRYLLRKAGMSHTHTEAYMGHWWHAREPFSPTSSFDVDVFLEELTSRLPDILEKQLEFWPIPGASVNVR